MKKTESRELLLSIFGVALLIIAIAGVTYAVFTYTTSGEKENTIKTGSISMSYQESDENIILINNAMPISDTVGMAQKDYFDFTISSTISGIATIKYEIWAESIATENALESDKIRVYLEKEKSGSYEKILEPTTFLPNLEKKMLLYCGTFSNSENKETQFIENYRFKMWLKEDTSIEENPRSFKLKINVYANT